MQTIDVLVKARRIIQSPDRWSGDETASREDGSYCLPESPKAVRWSMAGAVRKAGELHNRALFAALNELAWVCECPNKVCAHIEVDDWNEIHSHSEVIAAFDKAIKNARERLF